MATRNHSKNNKILNKQLKDDDIEETKEEKKINNKGKTRILISSIKPVKKKIKYEEENETKINKNKVSKSELEDQGYVVDRSTYTNYSLRNIARKLWIIVN